MLEEEVGLNLSPPASQALPQTITVQGRIRATGAAMSLPKKRDTTIDYMKVLKTARIRTGVPPKVDCAGLTSDEPQVRRATFLEDFTLNHSLNGLRVTSIEIAGIF